MSGKKPCAAATYAETTDAFLLQKMIRNTGDDCKDSGAALLCHLIRNSKNKKGEPSPLNLLQIEDEPLLQSYYKSFGCFKPAVAASDSKWYVQDPMICNDPNPPKCKRFVDKVSQGDSYARKLR
eukprot:gnl/TRDRNA2_/TRDRNA2_144589_c0_seq1.p1 gnl/TRDRNA2_/TRDRNA2_144589_c0~~gnl/TRDRNA2_/TRDRNA2_144589_c0_seq1.p1  ORF type:complete len:124 (+),score=20.22 gnl/TRDRNA2_/TRDRNA2_144589_c0_seq1:3-374(+)